MAWKDCKWASASVERVKCSTMLENVDRKPHKLILLGRAVTATLIGFVSMLVLYQTIRRDYYDYFLYPRLKAAEGYLYPQWRYVIADCAVIAWGTVGVLVSTLLYRSILKRLPLD